MAEEIKAPGTGPEAQPQPPQFTTDASRISTVYTNFCRVSVTPEELVLDFGLNSQMPPNPAEPIRLNQQLASQPTRGTDRAQWQRVESIRRQRRSIPDNTGR